MRNTEQLFVNMPIDKTVYVFDLPENIFDSIEEANQYLQTGYETLSLNAAFTRIAKDIQYDS